MEEEGDCSHAVPPKESSLEVFLETVRLDNEKADLENRAKRLELFRSATQLKDGLQGTLSGVDYKHAVAWVDNAICSSPPSMPAPGALKPAAQATTAHRRTWIEDYGFLFKSRAALAEWERLVCAGVPWLVAAAAVGAVKR